MDSDRLRILVLDPDHTRAKVIQAVLESDGGTVAVTADLREAIRLSITFKPNLVLIGPLASVGEVQSSLQALRRQAGPQRLPAILVCPGAWDLLPLAGPLDYLVFF